MVASVSMILNMYDGDKMMPEGVIQNSLGHASRCH